MEHRNPLHRIIAGDRDAFQRVRRESRHQTSLNLAWMWRSFDGEGRENLNRFLPGEDVDLSLASWSARAADGILGRKDRNSIPEAT